MLQTLPKAFLTACFVVFELTNFLIAATANLQTLQRPFLRRLPNQP
jgi:hypothetical protein